MKEINADRPITTEVYTLIYKELSLLEILFNLFDLVIKGAEVRIKLIRILHDVLSYLTPLLEPGFE